MTSYSELAARVARGLRHDEALKRGLLARTARYVSVMDAAEMSEMSARELAVAVLRKLGLAVPADPIGALSSWLDGRDAGERAHDYLIPGNRLTGGNRIPGGGSPILGSKGAGAGTQEEARDAREGGSFLDKYLEA